MLYLISTPLGNLKDITYRAIESLQSVDIIACEDTLHSLKLLNHYEIKKPLMSYHKFNEKESAARIISHLKDGKNVALISDAGMPCISDPGSILVNECIKNQVDYTIVPGATASLSALTLSGFDTTNFAFFGFIPKDNKKREQLKHRYSNFEGTLIFYIAPHNLTKTLDYLYEVLGSRKICLVKEITKLYEKCIFSTLGEQIDAEVKGEFVLIVEGKEEVMPNYDNLSVEEHYQSYLDNGYEKMQAIKQVAKDRKVHKSEIYRMINTED